MAFIFSKSHTIYFLCSCMNIAPRDPWTSVAQNTNYIKTVHPNMLRFVSRTEAEERVRRCDGPTAIQPVERLQIHHQTTYLLNYVHQMNVWLRMFGGWVGWPKYDFCWESAVHRHFIVKYCSLPGDLVCADFLFIVRPRGVCFRNKKIIYKLSCQRYRKWR